MAPITYRWRGVNGSTGTVTIDQENARAAINGSRVPLDTAQHIITNYVANRLRGTCDQGSFIQELTRIEGDSWQEPSTTT